MTQNVGDGELERSPRDTLLAIDKLSVGGGVELTYGFYYLTYERRVYICVA